MPLRENRLLLFDFFRSKLNPAINCIIKDQIIFCRQFLSDFEPKNYNSIYIWSNGKNSQISENIGEFKHLEKLTIIQSPLNSLPFSLKFCQNLREINFYAQFLSEKNLSNIIDQLAELPALESLTIQSNPISNIPENIGRLTHLKNLKLGSNHLSNLPDSLRNLQQLQYLDLQNNQFNNLPLVLSQLTNLQYLDLRENHFSHYSNFSLLLNLPNLSTLDLSLNQYNSIPESIIKLHHLKKLRLEKNQLVTLPLELQNMINLEYLDISRNPISLTFQESVLNLRSEEIIEDNDKRTDYSYDEIFETQEQLQGLYLKLDQYWNFIPRIIEKIKNDIPLGDFEKKFPLYSQYVHLLEPLCLKMNNSSSNQLLRLLKTKAQIKGSNKMKILL